MHLAGACKGVLAQSQRASADSLDHTGYENEHGVPTVSRGHLSVHGLDCSLRHHAPKPFKSNGPALALEAGEHGYSCAHAQRQGPAVQGMQAETACSEPGSRYATRTGAKCQQICRCLEVPQAPHDAVLAAADVRMRD